MTQSDTIIEHAADLRAMVRYLEDRGDIVIIDREVDPILELSAITKAMEGGPALLFTNVKGYPGRPVITNIFANRSRVADLFGAESEYLAKRLAEAIKDPVAPIEVETAPCQDVVITEDIDLLKLLPVPQITAVDTARVLTGGITVVKHPELGFFDLSYRRMAVDGRNWTGYAVNFAGHLADSIRKLGGRCPATVNIGCGPATLLGASGATQQTATPLGYSEAGFAGSLQNGPVRFVKARTQEAWALADAEWVLEGYIDMHDRATEGAGGATRSGYAPLMPEAGGYQGEAYTVPKFHVTAVTHRKNPIYYFPIGDANETVNLMGFPAEASIYDICKRLNPRVFDTCYALPGMRGIGGVVLRVRKETEHDDALTKNLIMAAFAGHTDLIWVVAVDEDIDITDANDVMWAMISRVDPAELLITPISAITTLFSRAKRVGRKIGFDATFPRAFAEPMKFQRPRFPACDLTQWLSPEQIRTLESRQDEYSRSFVRRRNQETRQR